MKIIREVRSNQEQSRTAEDLPALPPAQLPAGSGIESEEERPQGKYVSIADDVLLGNNVRVANFVNLYGCSIGDNTKIGVFVEVQKNAAIGRNCKIQSHTFICEGVVIEDEVFVGHGVTFVNDKYPRATNGNGCLQSEADWKVAPTRVKRGASIGSGATILCNLTIGEEAVIGSGSVVTKDVPPGAVVAGNPARILRTVISETNESCVEPVPLPRCHGAPGASGENEF